MRRGNTGGELCERIRRGQPRFVQVNFGRPSGVCSAACTQQHSPMTISFACVTSHGRVAEGQAGSTEIKLKRPLFSSIAQVG